MHQDLDLPNAQKLFIRSYRGSNFFSLRIFVEILYLLTYLLDVIQEVHFNEET